jgi:hypothetical protein
MPFLRDMRFVVVYVYIYDDDIRRRRLHNIYIIIAMRWCVERCYSTRTRIVFFIVVIIVLPVESRYITVHILSSTALSYLIYIGFKQLPRWWHLRMQAQSVLLTKRTTTMLRSSHWSLYQFLFFRIQRCLLWQPATYQYRRLNAINHCHWRRRRRRFFTYHLMRYRSAFLPALDEPCDGAVIHESTSNDVDDACFFLQWWKTRLFIHSGDVRDESSLGRSSCQGIQCKVLQPAEKNDSLPSDSQQSTIFLLAQSLPNQLFTREVSYSPIIGLVFIATGKLLLT